MVEKNEIKEHANLNDDEFEIVKRAQNGSMKDLDYIINKYRIMVMAKSKAYFLIGADKEDIIQEGMIGLYKAIRDFDDTKTCSFKNFADMCVTRQMITAVKTSTRQKHKPLNSYVSLNKPVFDEESERTLYDMFISVKENNPEKLIINKESYENTEKKIKEVLSPFEREVLMLYLSNQNYSNISKILNKDLKSIDNAMQRVKRKLEKLLENKED